MSVERESQDFIVRLRGLPWSVESEDVHNFMDGCGIQGINFLYNPEGRMTGEVYVELQTEEDFKQALRKHHYYIGSRYIDVIPATHSEMQYSMKKNGIARGEVNFEDAVVKVRGLPFSCDKDSLLEFFEGLPVTPNGVFLMVDAIGRASGEGFVQFASQSHADVALKKHGEKIGHRYIEIFKSTLAEARSSIGSTNRSTNNHIPPPRRPGPYDRHVPREHEFDRRRGGGDRMRRPYEEMEDRRGRRPVQNGTGDLSLQMRGLPFSASESDIIEFFYPLNPSRVSIEMNFEGRPSGMANVEFSSRYDIEQAMKRDRESMKHRYIELFHTGKPPSNNDYRSF